MTMLESAEAFGAWVTMIAAVFRNDPTSRRAEAFRDVIIAMTDLFIMDTPQSMQYPAPINQWDER